MPLWQGFTPRRMRGRSPLTQRAGVLCGAGRRRDILGASITPVIFRWNFVKRSKRVQPWFQAAGGLIYTTHKFPPDLLIPHGYAGRDERVQLFAAGRRRDSLVSGQGRSIDLGVNGVHISSASLGDRNPGVNASVQVQVGYTFWRAESEWVCSWEWSARSPLPGGALT